MMESHKKQSLSHSPELELGGVTGPEGYVGNFVDALQRLTMHWDALMQHVHYDAL